MSIDLFLKEHGVTDYEGNIQNIFEQMSDLVSLTNKPYINVMEVGFNAGHSADIMLKHNSKLTLTSFDLGEHDYLLDAKRYIDSNYPSRHTLIIGNSVNSIPLFTKQNPFAKFDVIFIDGGHSYEIAKADIDNCFHLAHRDTIVILDDTIFTPDWEETWTIGPTRTWIDHVNNKQLIELCRKEYKPGRGMSWGKYMI